ncbi:MAG: 2-hydroxyacyl-CoA dehydratase family protein, partial [Pseudomonadota bacterium]
DFVTPIKAPRVLVTGSPLGGDAHKVFKIIQEEGGVVVAMDSCTGRKPYVPLAKENSGDPLYALAEKYLQIPCSCMSPNQRRLDDLDEQIERYKPDMVIDVILVACHTYNIESIKLERHITQKHHLPFLKITTDYSSEDLGQLKTRIGALLEMQKQ